MSTQSDIQSAFMQSLASYLSTNLLTYPIADENQDFNAPDNPPSIWLKTDMLRATAVVAELGDIGRNMQKGIFQIGVYGPKNQGRAATLAVADALVEWFRRGTVLAYGSVADIKVRISWAAKQIPDPNWFCVPVSVEYFAFTDN